MRGKRRVAVLLLAGMLLWSGCSFRDAAESALRWFYREDAPAAAGGTSPSVQPGSEAGGVPGTPPAASEPAGGGSSEGLSPSDWGDGGLGTDAGGVPASEASGDNPADTGPFTIYTLRPVDESAKDAALVQFLASLKKAVAAKDAAALTALLDPEVSAGDGTQGLDAFRRRWGLDKGAAASPLWALINTALSMGGAFAPGASDTFVLPYAAALFPSRLDPSRYRVVTAANVNVRAQPSLDAPAVGTAAYLVVRRLDPAAGETLPAVTLNGQAYRWVKVQLPSGTVGYMVEKYLWNPAVRVVLRKSSGGWRVAGVEGG